ncbi:MAG: imelysin family protein [Paracoccaceae bacterium]
MRLSIFATIAFLLLALPLRADFPETVRDHILPGYLVFAEATAELDRQAQADCGADALRPAFNAAWDGWMGIQHIRLGPVEVDGRGLSIAYWPDPKASGARVQRGLLAASAADLEPQAFAELSVAARGFPALERLLFPSEPLPGDPCALIRATAADLARTAATIEREWREGHADRLLTAGEAGNDLYLTRPEVRQALFTQLASGLEFIDDQRLGRPLGKFGEPHPEKAEARLSGRSLRNIMVALQAMREMVVTLTPDAPRTLAAFDRAIEQARTLDDPVFAGVSDPESRLKVEILQQSVQAIRQVILEELAPELDVGIGFNAQDGD